MKRLQPIRRLCRNEKGATAVEFAIVAGAFFMLMFAIIEYGLIMFSRVIIESAIQQAGRSASIGEIVPGCSDRACSVKALVTKKTFGLIDNQSVFVTATVVSSPTTTTPSVPDICLDSISTPYPSTCLRWVENSGGPGYQQPVTLSGGDLGAAEKLVEIRATYLWRVIFPFFRSSFGPDGVYVITSSTVIKNEPF